MDHLAGRSPSQTESAHATGAVPSPRPTEGQLSLPDHILDDGGETGERNANRRHVGDAGYLRVADGCPPVDAIEQSLLICDDAQRALRLLPGDSVQTVVTSPPYWSLRDYDVDDQIGLNDELEAYILSIVAAFDELRRVLRPDGTVWLNVGDSYTSGNRRYRAPDRKNRARAMRVRPPTPRGLKPKDLIGVPWRLALALQADGWWLRSETIWHKPNAHPESVRDRPTKAHETIFLLSKDQNYYYDTDSIRGPRGRRLRDVWDIPTEPLRRNGAFADDHPAMMPLSLAEQCIALTSRRNSVVLDPYAGSGTTLLAANRLERRWVGIELKPSFVDLIEQRLHAK